MSKIGNPKTIKNKFFKIFDEEEEHKMKEHGWIVFKKKRKQYSKR